MRRNAHVRFGGRPAETHPRKRGQGAAGRPYIASERGARERLATAMAMANE